jgi:hypothetical protein
MSITSMPFRPNPEMCCEACVFGRGEHAEWCYVRTATCPMCDGELVFDLRDRVRLAQCRGWCKRRWELWTVDPLTIRFVDYGEREPA